MPLPYIEPGPFSIGPLRLTPFMSLMGTGLLTGHLMLRRRARLTGLDPDRAAAMNLAMIAAGFLVSPMFKFLYNPQVLRHLDPRTIFTGGYLALSSFGGILGAIAGAAAFLRWQRLSLRDALAYLNAAAYAFPFGWIFGRSGCAVVHDHPGIRSTSPLAVAYPDGPRLDLGLLEVFFMALLIVVLLVAGSRLSRDWPLFGVLLLVYGSFRIALDRLHVDPPLYFAVSVDQWAGMFLVVASFAALYWSRRA
ncbi:MAG: prolipoprotein diacylglyceryl transferase [Bryobacteraceae bacterium]